MSLVNKMLQDLEARQNDTRGGRPLFQDLQSAHHDRRRPVGKLIFLAVALLAGGGYLAWQYWDVHSVPPVQTAALTAPPVAAPAPPPAIPAPAASEATVAAALPAPVAKRPAPTDSKPGASAPAAEKAKPVRRPRSDPAQAASASPSITKTDRPYTPEELSAIAYREAMLARTQGNPAEAERRLKALLAAQPQHKQARELLATIQVENGRWPEAQETLEQGVTQVPDYAAFRFQLARLHLDHGSEAKAVAVLERARADNIKDPELPAFLAALYQRSGRHDEAIRNYREALAARPAEGKWWLGLGISLEARPDAAAARDAYQRALDTNQLNASLVRYAEERLKVLAAR